MKVLRGGKLVTVTRAELLKSQKETPVATMSESPELPSIDEEEVSSDSDYDSLTIAQLKEFLDENKVEYSKTSKKADLVELADLVEIESEL